jgi:hypothetical protein
MKARGIFLWTVLLLFAQGVYLVAEQPVVGEAADQESSEYKFITLILHGWSDAIAE